MSGHSARCFSVLLWRAKPQTGFGHLRLGGWGFSVVQSQTSPTPKPQTPTCECRLFHRKTSITKTLRKRQNKWIPNSDMATAAKRMRIAEHSPISGATAASTSHAIDTPMLATRLFHQSFEEAETTSSHSQHHQQGSEAGDFFRFGGAHTPTHHSVCSSSAGFDSPVSGIASAGKSPRPKFSNPKP